MTISMDPHSRHNRIILPQDAQKLRLLTLPTPSRRDARLSQARPQRVKGRGGTYQASLEPLASITCERIVYFASSGLDRYVEGLNDARTPLADFSALRYIGLTGMNHFGFMRPKSVRTWLRSSRFESSTTGPQGPRQNTAQCQNERPRSLCHLTASNARSGKASHEVKGTSVLAGLIPNS